MDPAFLTGDVLCAKWEWIEDERRYRKFDGGRAS